MSFNFNISLSVLNHLGRNLYRNFVTILGEAISNSWDAGADNVWIEFDRSTDDFLIIDDGKGMTEDDFQRKFLRIGYSKRNEFGSTNDAGRPFIGAKGIGKLALLSCANRITIVSKVEGGEWVGGTIDNSELDDAIEDELEATDYPLAEPDMALFGDELEGLESGTAIHFSAMNEGIRNSEAFIRKMIAMTFRFSTVDPEFSIHVNDEEVTVEDLADLSANTQFLWTINGHSDEYVESLSELGAVARNITVPNDIGGFLATVTKPSHAKVRGTQERASVDLYVNGRLRERDVGRHVGKQRIVESYLYGVIDFNRLDSGEGQPDAFTSSREGVKATDPRFQELLLVLGDVILPAIIDQWDELRLELGKKGDDENTSRKSKKDRAAQNLFSEAKEEFEPDDDAPNKDEIHTWLEELRPDAEYNLGSYSDIFISENLIRKFIKSSGSGVKGSNAGLVEEYRKRETESKGKANISFAIRHEDDDLSYLDMPSLAYNAETVNKESKHPSLHRDAVEFKPMRDALSHTARLSPTAKARLSGVVENIKGRLRTLLAQMASKDDPDP